MGLRSSLEDVQLNMKHPSYSLEVHVSLHVNDRLHGSVKAEFASWQDHGVALITTLKTSKCCYCSGKHS